MSNRPDQLGFRLPAGMADRIKKVARADKRTMTSWLEKVVSDALEAEENRQVTSRPRELQAA